MKLQLAKGMRDIEPEQKLRRDGIVTALKAVFERFGYLPLETPTLERLETLSSKYAGGDEILKETFRLKDQGKRELGLRYDLTVPLSRYIGMNPQLKMPFKRYAIGKVFRDGPIKLGRYREFWQLDVDIVGSKSMRADAETLTLAEAAFKELGQKVTIKVNSRKLLNGLLEDAGVKDKETVILTLDKLEKFGEEAVKQELKEKGLDAKTITKIFSFLIQDLKQLKKSIKDKEGQDGINELEELFMFLKATKSKAEFEVSLARGLAYYTGTVFEVFLKDSPIKSSIAAGGRYDRMIGQLLGGKQDFPAVGISFGLDVLADALPKADIKTKTTLYIIPIGTDTESMKLAAYFRNAGVNTDIDVIGRGVSKNLNFANTMGIPHVLFVGEDELAQSRFKLRDMKTGKEELLSRELIIEKLA
ncbi:MAG: histidine--tRNA ligase [Nanoarchaeota archaeon]|nr:histidine--tRNA ligase [Nanoarchaeota archaeon]